jgi:hypothetical protein
MEREFDAMLSRQLDCATEMDAVFCVRCGQPDEPSLHDPARCPGAGGERDPLTVAEALVIWDQSNEELEELSIDARALHCAMLAASRDLGHGWICYNSGPGAWFWSATRETLVHELSESIRPATSLEKAMLNAMGNTTEHVQVHNRGGARGLKLLAHFKRMQVQVASYLEPAQYVPFHGGPCQLNMNAAEEKGRFIEDMIYMLDGPEQREAQTEAERLDKIATREAQIREICERGTQAHGDEFFAPILKLLDIPQIGDGTPDAALAIGEHAFRAGHRAGFKQAYDDERGRPTLSVDEALSNYDPPEHIKALS